VLVGRDGEIELIGEALRRARNDEATVLRVSGDPGLGKTALLEVAESQATAHAMTVVRFTAIESESEIPSSALDLMLSLLGRATEVSASPATLLEALTSASRSSPLALLVDDLQWLDDRSMRALAFACRRLLADPVAVLLACRTPSASDTPFDSFPRIHLEPLTIEQSIQLLGQAAPEMPTDVADQVARELAGVPLALVGVRDLLSPEELVGDHPLPSPVPVDHAVQVRYAAGWGALDEDGRRALTLLAADDTADPTVIVAGLAVLGLDLGALLPAERGGLVRIDRVPRFVHPLARAAVHAAAPSHWSRESHAALGEVLHQRGDARGLRHRALGCAGPDEDIAAELETAATWLATDGPGRASLLAQLSADLSPDPTDRQRRLLLAAETSSDSGNAVRLANQVLACRPDPNLQARATFVVADNLHGADPTTLLQLLNGVDREHVDPDLAAELLSRLTWTAMEDADLTLLDRLIAAMGTADRGDDWVLLSAMGSALMFLGRNQPAVKVLRRAAELSADLDPADLSTDLLTGWAVIPGWLGEDDSAARARFRRMDQLLRARDRPIDQVYADFFGSERARREGGWDRAISLLTHEIAILHALGYPEGVDEARLAGLHAYRGDEDVALAHIAAAQRAFARRPSPWLELWVTQARGALALTMGRPEEAAGALGAMRAVPFLGRGCRDAVVVGLVDLVEALVEMGDRRAAAAVTDEVQARTQGLVDPLGRALVARCRALTRPTEAETLLTLALEDLDRTAEVFEQARTHLHLGEHLRRTRRRRLSRTHLVAAGEAFTYMGARPWAARAHRELIASGERATPRSPEADTSDAELTPQELRVALEVARGQSNAQVAGVLFLSAKTVEFHLGKVYRKLGVRSRGGLAQALGSRGLLDIGG
jgi:DNA-binding CsgD family transcriptional regulator